MLVVAVAALIVMALSAWLLHDALDHSHGHAPDPDNPDDPGEGAGSAPGDDDHHGHAHGRNGKANGHALNLRGAWLHLLGDTLGALAALVAALVIRFGGARMAGRSHRELRRRRHPAGRVRCACCATRRWCCSRRRPPTCRSARSAASSRASRGSRTFTTCTSGRSAPVTTPSRSHVLTSSRDEAFARRLSARDPVGPRGRVRHRARRNLPGPIEETLDRLAPVDYAVRTMRIPARLLLSAAFAAFFSLYAGAASAQMKVAVVDVQRAVTQTEEGLRATATLKKEFDSRQQELNKRQTELQKQKDEIDKQSHVLSQQALQKKFDDWQRQMIEFQNTYVAAQKELEKQQKSLTDPIFEKVMIAIKRIAGTDGFDLIVDRSAVAFSRTDLDVTDRVIQVANGASGGSRRSVVGRAAVEWPEGACAAGACAEAVTWAGVVRLPGATLHALAAQFGGRVLSGG